MKPEWIFRLFETSNPEHLSFVDTASLVEYSGRHHGYERLSQPVVHERTLRLSKPDGALTIVDHVTGRGEHSLRWHFHLAPGVDAVEAGPGLVELLARGRRWTLCAPTHLQPTLGVGSYSPSYGVKVPCRTIDFDGRVRLDGTHTWRFSITA